MGDFTMPSLGAEMDEGRVIEWLVAPGDKVKRGDTVAVVETDKAALDVEVWEDGVVEAILIEAGAKVPVGTPLARIGAGVGAAVAAAPPEPAPVAAPAATEPVVAPPQPVAAPPQPVVAPPTPVVAPPPPLTVPATPVPVPVGGNGPVVRGPLARHRADELHIDLTRVRGTGPGGVITRHDVEAAGARPRVSPYARRLAAERGVDLGALAGTGPDGAIVARDLAAAPTSAPSGPPTPTAPTPTAAPPPSEPKPAAPAAEAPDRAETMRLAIARAMAWSKQHIPHYYLGNHVDVTDVLTWLADLNATRPVRERVLPAAVFLHAIARAARDVPEMNGFWQDERFVPAESVHLGVGVSLRGGGLIAPAILDADRLTVDETMAALKDLVGRARKGHLKARETTAGTLTVTNLGDLGVETVYGVIYPPQVAIVGIGRVMERPWAHGGLLGVRQVVHLTLAADHRASDGMVGAHFLDRVAELLQPEG
jgi:pyruvate dehydrogenase E2 component (dihydrolipoamide acetyltransferase)